MKLIKIILAMLYCSCSLAQEITPAKVKVLEGFNPKIPNSEKIKETTIFIDTNEIDKIQEYFFLNKIVDANYRSRKLTAAKISGEQISDLRSTHVSLAFGTHSITSSKILLNSTRNDNYTYNISLNHFNNDFKLDEKKADWSDNSINLFVKNIAKKNILTANLDHERKIHYSYGHDEDLILFDNNDLKRRFIYTKLGVSFISKELSDQRLRYNTHFFISDLNQMAENRIHLRSTFSKEINGYPLDLGIDIDKYINYGRSDFESKTKDILGNKFIYKTKDVTLISMSPSISLNKLGIDINIGLGIDYESDGGLDAFPSIIAEKEIVKDVLVISSGVQDDKYRNTYKTLSEKNPFIHALGTNQSAVLYDTLQDLRTTEAKEFFLSISNVLGVDETFNVDITFGYIENFPYFSNNYDSIFINQFLVHYEDLWQLHTSIVYDWKINHLLGLKLDADYYHWTEDILHRSNFEAEASIFVNLRDKIKIYPSVSYLGIRDVLEEDVSTITSLASQFHANIRIDYNYNKSFTSFISINNITNSRKYIWKDYREIGINSFFGLSYSF